MHVGRKGSIRIRPTQLTHWCSEQTDTRLSQSGAGSGRKEVPSNRFQYSTLKEAVRSDLINPVNVCLQLASVSLGIPVALFQN